MGGVAAASVEGRRMRGPSCGEAPDDRVGRRAAALVLLRVRVDVAPCFTRPWRAAVLLTTTKITVKLLV